MLVMQLTLICCMCISLSESNNELKYGPVYISYIDTVLEGDLDERETFLSILHERRKEFVQWNNGLK